MPSDAIDFLVNQGFLENQEGTLVSPTLLDDGINIGVGRNLSKKPLRPDELTMIEDDLMSRGAPVFPLDNQLSSIATKEPQGVFLSSGPIRVLLKNDTIDAFDEARSVVGPDIFDDLGEPQKAMLTSMAMNLGQSGLAEFKGMISAIQDGKITQAVQEFFDSARAGNRADPKTGARKAQVAPRRLASEAFMLKHNKFPSDIEGKQHIKEFTGPGMIPGLFNKSEQKGK